MYACVQVRLPIQAMIDSRDDAILILRCTYVIVRTLHTYAQTHSIHLHAYVYGCVHTCMGGCIRASVCAYVYRCVHVINTYTQVELDGDKSDAAGVRARLDSANFQSNQHLCAKRIPKASRQRLFHAHGAYMYMMCVCVCVCVCVCLHVCVSACLCVHP